MLRFTMLLLLLWLLGCDDHKSGTPAASASVSVSGTGTGTGTGTVSVPVYSGPTGTLTGVVHIKGDEAPRTSFEYPAECRGAEAMYGKLFRTGLGGELADALVAVTKYKGFVPPKSDIVPLTIKDCAYSTRTVAMTDDQHLEVRNLDGTTSYVPHLDGARSPVVNAAVPKGDPVKLYSRGRMRYWLRDQMGRKFMVADVFHLPYSTTSVTGLDGRYRIEGIPVGKVQVSVMLPAANLKTVNQDFQIKEGENVLDLTLPFDAKTDAPKKKAPAPK